VNIRELRDRLLAIDPEVRVPDGGRVDDLYPFRFASTTFVPPFMDALMRVVLGADPDGTAERRLTALAGLLEVVFVDGDEDLGDAVAMRLVYSRLCLRPTVLSGAWPFLGQRTRHIAGKFLRLIEECDRREAAVLAAAGAGIPPATEPAVPRKEQYGDDNDDQAAAGGGEERVPQETGGRGLRQA
jgi:hypothetical protein